MRLLAMLFLIGCGGGGHESPTAPPMPGGGGAATLSGIVTTVGTSSPVAGAVVTAAGQSSTTGTDGRYTLTGLTATTITLTVTRSGYESYSRTITLTAGANLLDVQLSQSTGGTSVTGNVHGLYPLDGTTRNLVGARVTIAGKTDTTDASGNFQLPTIPEGNQLVTVTLPGWQDYAQSFFISSTNRTLSLAMTYALPNLKNISLVPEWQVCSVGCANSYNRAFTARLRPSTSYQSLTSFTIEASYQAYATVSGHAANTADHVRRGLEATCSNGYCTDVPGITPTPGVVYQGTTGTNGAPFTNWFLGKFQPPTSSPSGQTGFLVVVGYDPAACRARTDYFNGSDVTVGFRGSLTIKASNDMNEWTHYTIPFDISTPWMTAPNSTFCN